MKLFLSLFLLSAIAALTTASAEDQLEAPTAHDAADGATSQYCQPEHFREQHCYKTPYEVQQKELRDSDRETYYRQALASDAFTPFECIKICSEKSAQHSKNYAYAGVFTRDEKVGADEKGIPIVEHYCLCSTKQPLQQPHTACYPTTGNMKSRCNGKGENALEFCGDQWNMPGFECSDRKIHKCNAVGATDKDVCVGNGEVVLAYAVERKDVTSTTQCQSHCREHGYVTSAFYQNKKISEQTCSCGPAITVNMNHHQSTFMKNHDCYREEKKVKTGLFGHMAMWFSNRESKTTIMQCRDPQYLNPRVDIIGTDWRAKAENQAA